MQIYSIKKQPVYLHCCKVGGVGVGVGVGVGSYLSQNGLFHAIIK
jgi:hypothetical protein